MAKQKPKFDPNSGDWIGIPEAAILIEATYLKTRDLALSGVFGHVEKDRGGRYWVQKSEVEAYVAKTR